MFTLFACLRALLRTRHHLGLEILASRQQVAVLKRKHPRPRLNNVDRLFWIALRRFSPRWTDALVLVRPETVVGWHRASFRLYWRLRSRGTGRKIGAEMFEIVRRMARENPALGRPQNPRRIAEAWLRHLRAHGVALPGAPAAAPRRRR